MCKPSGTTKFGATKARRSQRSSQKDKTRALKNQERAERDRAEQVRRQSERVHAAEVKREKEKYEEEKKERERKADQARIEQERQEQRELEIWRQNRRREQEEEEEERARIEAEKKRQQETRCDQESKDAYEKKKLRKEQEAKNHEAEQKKESAKSERKTENHNKEEKGKRQYGGYKNSTWGDRGDNNDGYSWNSRPAPFSSNQADNSRTFWSVKEINQLPVNQFLTLPTTNLDPISRKAFEERIQRMSQASGDTYRRFQDDLREMKEKRLEKWEEERRAENAKKAEQELKKRLRKEKKRLDKQEKKNKQTITPTNPLDKIISKTSAFFHRLVKEFDSERVIYEDEVPKGEDPTKKKSHGYEQEQESPSENNGSASGSEAKRNESSNGKKSSSDEKQTLPKGKQNNATEDKSKPKMKANGTGSKNAKTDKVSSNDQKESSNQSNEAPQNPGQDPQIVNVESFEDGVWLYNSDIEGYMEFLQNRHSAETNAVSLSFVKDGIIAKYNGEWHYNADMLYSCINTDYKRHFGVLANGEHFVGYLIDTEKNMLTVYLWDGMTSYWDDMRKGARVLLNGLNQEFQEQLTLDLTETTFIQDDSYNCGIACLLEYEKLLTGKVPANSLDAYREKARNNLRQEQQETSKQNSHTNQKYTRAQTSSDSQQTSSASQDKNSPSHNERAESQNSCKNRSSKANKSEPNFSSSKNKNPELKNKNVQPPPKNFKTMGSSESQHSGCAANSSDSNNSTTTDQTNKTHFANRKQTIESRNDNCGSEIPSFHDQTHQDKPTHDGKIDTLEKLVNSYNGMFKLSDSGIHCLACKKTGTKKGSFGYDFSNGTNFEKVQIPKPFHNLKQKLREHLNTSTHKNAANLEDPAKHPVALDDNTRQAGLILARNAYHTYYRSESYRSFPMQMVVDFHKNLDVGDINHSRFFVANIGKSFHKALKARVKQILETPLHNTLKRRPFAIIADKCTPNKDTMHLIGVVFPIDGELRAVFLKAEPISQSNGKYLAQSILNTLLEYLVPEEIRQRCVGFAFDGQYFHLKVPTHFLNLLGVQNENHEYYSARHDPAHVIELAGKDARQQRGDGLVIRVPWIRDTISIVSKGSQHLNWGKNWSALKEAFEELREELNDAGSEKFTLKRFKRWCDTRFTAYAVNVFETFRNNYPLVYNRLAETNTHLYDQIRHVLFPLRLTALVDIYGRIASSSKMVQRVNHLPWQVEDELDGLCASLNRMKACLEADRSARRFPHELPLWSELEKCVNEIDGRHTYQNRSVYTTDDDFLPGVAREYIHEAYENAAKHIDDFVSHLNRRTDDPKHKKDMDRYIRDCFSFKKIAEQTTTGVPLTSLEELVRRSQIPGYLDPSISMETMRDEYSSFVKYIYETRGDLDNGGMYPRSEETSFYNNIICGDEAEVQNHFPHVAQLIASSCTRTSCESATESFGSTLKNILTGRESLATDSQDAEMFFRINGPPPTNDADNLLRDAMDLHFGGPVWHNRRTSNKRKLQPYVMSQSGDGENMKKGKITYTESIIDYIRWGQK